MDLGKSTVIPDFLFNQQLVIGKCSDLRRVGNAQHLVAAGGLFQLLANAPGGKAGNTGVDLIINNGRNRIFISQGALERQHDTGKLAAGSDFSQRLGLLAGVGRNQKFNVILSCGS